MTPPATRRNTLRLAARHLDRGDAGAARSTLDPLARAAPDDAQVQHEFALILAAMGQEEAALRALRHAAFLKPDNAQRWRALGDLHLLLGEAPQAGQAYAQSIRAGATDPALAPAALALAQGNPLQAEQHLATHLQQHATDVTALWLLAEAAMRIGRIPEALAVLQGCLALSPDFLPAHRAMAILFFQQQLHGEAVPHLRRLVRHEPANTSLAKLLSAALVRSSGHEAAIPIYEALLKPWPHQPNLQLLYGHALKAAGRQADAVVAYRRCIAMLPGFASAWLSLADLKTHRFTEAELAVLSAQIASNQADPTDQSKLHYALGQALEAGSQYEAAFTHYATGARLRRDTLAYDPGSTTRLVDESCRLLTADFFAARHGWGSPSEAPIFIVGLPRSGSTLVEQILASHPEVEGTSELPDIGEIARDLAAQRPYPAILAALDDAACRQLGERYLAGAAQHRRLGRSRFTDKMPGNLLHAGLITLILPQARIVEIRRAPMAAGFAAFKQSFPERQDFSYDLTDIARHIRDTTRLSAHIHHVLPGRILTIDYEIPHQRQ